MAITEDEGELSLSAEKRRLTEERILDATMTAIGRRGLSATVEEIADIAGISARTIYRYFDTRDELVAAGMRRMLKAFEQPIPDLPSITEDLDGWIDGIALASATRNISVLGAAFWEFVRPTPSASKEIEEARKLRRPTRIQWMNLLAVMTWETAGGKGDPPSSLVTTIALALSAFTFHALAADFDFGPEESAQFAASMIKERLMGALEAQRSSSRPAER
jgi:AcrR family transcriptional regulator